MRKLIKHFVVLILLLFIVGCNQATTTLAPTTEGPTSEVLTSWTVPITTEEQITQTTIPATTTIITTTEEETTMPYLESMVEELMFVMEVENNFYLPAFLEDIQASWETTNTDYIIIADEVTFYNDNFVYEVSVTRPSYVEGDQSVKITGTFTHNSDEYIKDFNFLVIAIPALYYLELDIELIEEAYIVETEFVLPVLEYSTYSNILISTEIADYLTYAHDEFTVIRPETDTVGTISFDVTYGDALENVEVQITLLAEIIEVTYDYVENFSWVNTTNNAYATAFSNTDGNGFEWSLFGRGDLDYFTLGNSSDGSFVQVTAAGGISSFSIDMVRAFTNANIRSAELFINDVSYGVFTIDVASDVWQNFTIDNINVSGTVVIKLVSTSPGSRGAFHINNFSWSTYTEEVIE